MATSDCDPIPGWLTSECVYQDLCQCHLLGSHPKDWHRPGALYSNVVCRRFRLFKERCGCSHVGWQFPLGCGRNIKNREIAIMLSRIVIHVLRDMPPSVPPRGEAMVSVLTSRERKLHWERERLRGIRSRSNKKDDYWRGYVDESDGGESSEEESIA